MVSLLNIQESILYVVNSIHGDLIAGPFDTAIHLLDIKLHVGVC